MPPITKIWIMTLRAPPHTAKQDPALLACLQDILDFCNAASGPEHAAHGFWQDAQAPARLVMITGYPSEESNLAADKEYVASGRVEKMFGFVQHEKLLQVDIDAATLPLDSVVLVVSSAPCACGRQPVLRSVPECGPCDAEEREGGGSDGAGRLGRHGVEMELGKFTSNVFVTIQGAAHMPGAEIQGAGSNCDVLHLKRFLPS